MCKSRHAIENLFFSTQLKSIYSIILSFFFFQFYISLIEILYDDLETSIKGL